MLNFVIIKPIALANIFFEFNFSKYIIGVLLVSYDLNHTCIAEGSIVLGIHYPFCAVYPKGYMVTLVERAHSLHYFNYLVCIYQRIYILSLQGIAIEVFFLQNRKLLPITTSCFEYMHVNLITTL